MIGGEDTIIWEAANAPMLHMAQCSSVLKTDKALNACTAEKRARRLADNWPRHLTCVVDPQASLTLCSRKMAESKAARMIVNERLSVQLPSEDGLIELARRIAQKTGGRITIHDARGNEIVVDAKGRHFDS